MIRGHFFHNDKPQKLTQLFNYFLMLFYYCAIYFFNILKYDDKLNLKKNYYYHLRSLLNIKKVLFNLLYKNKISEKNWSKTIDKILIKNKFKKPFNIIKEDLPDFNYLKFRS